MSVVLFILETLFLMAVGLFLGVMASFWIERRWPTKDPNGDMGCGMVLCALIGTAAGFALSMYLIFWRT